jgi:predicted signal transduction protein with EAL and GGDEF domain
VSWTVGVAVCPDEAATAEELLALADRRLYENKTARRGTA